MEPSAPGAEPSGPDATTLVEMSGIHKSFGGHPVLRGVDFSVRAGEVHVLAGENGAGKSTLIRILAGVLRADAGEVRVRGEPARVNSSLGPRPGIAVIHQELSLCLSRSLAENLWLGRERTRRGGWLERRAMHEEARKALARVGLDLDPGTETGRLPLAARQLVEIARALSLDARVIVMDEPTSALPRADVDRLFERIEEWTEAGAGIVFISHRLEEIERIADRVTVLRDGVSVVTAPAAELPPAEIVRAMVGRTVDEAITRHSVSRPEVRLRVHGLSTRTGADATLEDVSFELHRGEVLGVAGLRDSGASELMHAIFGDGARRSGTIEVDGVPAEVDRPSAAIRAGLALVPSDRQEEGLCPNLPIRENLSLASLDRLTRGGFLDARRERSLAADAARAVGVRARSLEQPVRTLSGGNQQKVVLGRWQARGAKVLLLDDPTRGVDVGAKEEIYARMKEWCEAGLSVLLTSTELPELIGLSDRILVLHRGRVTARLGKDHCTPERVMAAAMGEPVGSES